jgi:hypothetical protein
MKILKNSFYLILLLVLVFEALIYTGFCFKQFRYISDDEKKRIAIAYILKENRANILEYKDRATIYPFDTVDEFLASNPISCGTSSKLRGGLDWFEKVNGNLSSYVILEFMGIYKGNPKKAHRLIAITNCGDAWNPLDYY